MKIGIGSYVLRWGVGTQTFKPAKPLTPVELLDKAASAGAQVVQICDNMPIDHLTDGELRLLLQHARSRSLDLEVGIRGGRPELLRRYLSIARILESPLLRMVISDDEWIPDFDTILSIIRDFIPELERAGITLAIENHFEMPPAELRRLIETIDHPQVGACLDILNSISLFAGPTETIRELAPFAVSVHVKDAVIQPHKTGFCIEGRPLGEGMLDIRGAVQQVARNGHNPNVLLECWMDRLDSEDATLQQELRWMQDGLRFLRSVV